jgi:sporulation protein YtfJ
MAEHPIQGMMGVTMDKIRDLVDSNTIIGDPIQVGDGTTIIPVSKVTFGFASAGSDVGAKSTKDMFGGGSGAGVSVTPIAFLIVHEGSVRTVQLSECFTTMDRAIGMIPELVEKVTALLKKGKADTAAAQEKPRQTEPQTKQ